MSEQGEKSAGLTSKQRLFVSEYLIDLNATQAAIRAGYSEKTANEQGARLLANASVSAEIERILNERLVTIGVNADEILQKYVKFANADMKDFVTWKTEKVVTGYDDDGEPIVDMQTRICLKPSDDVDGTLIQEVTETHGKHGPVITVKLIDRMKALDALAKYANLFVDRNKRRTEENKMLIELERLKIEHKKLEIQLNLLERDDLGQGRLDELARAIRDSTKALLGDKE